jgi:hypothetical protein
MKRVPWAILLVFAAQRTADAQEMTTETAPPVVVKTIPEAGSKAIDPASVEIRVTFSKDMTDGSWSAVKASPDSFPKIVGKIRYENDGRTCVLPVKLEPGRDYALWLNTDRFKNFKDRDGRSALPYLLVFRTNGDAAAVPARSPELFGRAFDELGDDMARNYSYFELKRVDWDVLRADYRPKAVASKDEREFVSTLAEMLSQLKDGHVWIDLGEKSVPTFVMSRPQGNFNRKATLESLDATTKCGEFAVVGKTKGDGFGAIVLTRQSSADFASVKEVLSSMDLLRGAPGFLVDLRSANGGNESLARQIASFFCGREVVYARSKFRNGPAPTDFGSPKDRLLPASESPYLKPIVCLIGSGCVSSGEGFAKMMKSLPHVTMVGAPTRGSSGNPQPFRLPGLDVSVWYSRWVDLLPDGTPIEGKGIVPDVEVTAPAGAYVNADPTWEKAIEALRIKVEQVSRATGKS